MIQTLLKTAKWPSRPTSNRRRIRLTSMHSRFPHKWFPTGEYMPGAQTEKPKRVEARIEELSPFASRRLGIDRRRFSTDRTVCPHLHCDAGRIGESCFNGLTIENVSSQRPDRSRTAPRDLGCLTVQLHMVTRGFANLEAALAVAGPRQTSGTRENPFKAQGQLDERGESMGRLESGNCRAVRIPRRSSDS